MENKTTFPEAGAVAYFSFKRTDGFEVSLTLRDEKGLDLMTRIEGAIQAVKKQGATPLPLRGGFGGAKKPVDYVVGRKCPLCQNQLVHATTGAGKRFIKCSTNKWDFATKQAVGCKFIEWEQPKQEQKAEEVIPAEDYPDFNY